MNSDILLAVELRSTRRQRQERYVAGNPEVFGAVPTCLIENEDRMSAGGDPCGDLIEMKLHGFGVAESRVTCDAPHCYGTMCLVRHLNLDGVPEIYVFYCSHCQHAETVTQEREQAA